MCLILFAFQQHPDYPLIVLANRDEFYQRPTLAARHWPDQPDIYAGRDAEAQGTWMGINKRGSFAAVTNYRETPNPDDSSEPPPSRGQLPTAFLAEQQQPEHYLQQLASRSQDYAGFNLLLGDSRQLFYYSNRQHQIHSLNPGIYGLSNGLLNDNWPKVREGRQALLTQLRQGLDRRELLNILQDRDTPNDDELPDTGIGLEAEQTLGSRFIHSKAYGTRSSALLLAGDTEMEYFEQQYDNHGHTSSFSEHIETIST